jgi:hypothetical protein
VVLDRVVKAAYQAYGNNTYIYKLILSIKNNRDARFDAWVYVSKQALMDAEFKHENFPNIPWVLHGKKLYLRLLFVERTDKYASKCEPKARFIKLNPKLCFCSRHAEELMEAGVFS